MIDDADAARAPRLSALDALFLAIEDERDPMHVGATMVFDQGPLARADGTLDVPRILAHYDGAIDSVPRLRMRLTHVPVVRHPVWVDDARFDLARHVRHVRLPAPGGDAELRALLGRFHAQRLDRDRPLWETWIIEGLSGGRFAMALKAHHCLVDGIAGMAVLVALLSPDPEAAPAPPSRWTPAPAPSRLALLADEARRRAREPAEITRALRELATQHRGVMRETARDAAAGLYSLARAVARPAPRTGLNPARVGAARGFDWAVLELDDVRAIKHAAGATVNDVVLAVVTGVLRRYLLQRGEAVDGLSLRALVPVSSHVVSGLELGNEVSLVIAELPVGEPDARARLRRVIDGMRSVKAAHQSLFVALGEKLADVTTTDLLSVAAEVAIHWRPFNVIVTNVPGPPVPLYLLGAPLREVYPLVPLYRNQAVGVAIVSYAGRLYFGLNADRERVPDLALLAAEVTLAAAELRDALGV